MFQFNFIQILSLDWLPFQNHLEFKTEISNDLVPKIFFFFWCMSFTLFKIPKATGVLEACLPY